MSRIGQTLERERGHHRGRHTRALGGFDDDIALIGRLGQRDGEALEELYAHYASVVFSMAHRVLRDPQLTEELVQDVFLQAWRDAGSYDPARGPVRAWLLVITRARALDRLRSRRARDARVAEFQRSDTPRFPPTSFRSDDRQLATGTGSW